MTRNGSVLRIFNREFFFRLITAAAAILVMLLLLSTHHSYGMSTTAITAEGEHAPEGMLQLIYQQSEILIHNQIAASRHEYHFRNDFNADLEITCDFEQLEGELIEGFSYFNGSERIVGEVLEKRAAAEVYESLTQIQRDPGIVERTEGGFRFRVYPVQPGETKPVELRTLLALEVLDDWVNLRIPQSNLPRGGVFSLVVDITDDLAIVGVETVGLEGQVNCLGPRHCRVTFETEEGAFDRDVVIRYRVEAGDYGVRLVTHRAPGVLEGTFMLMVTPKAENRQQEAVGRDIVFVVDISGSMSGEPLEKTKWALNWILDRLDVNDRFDVIPFDDDTYSFFKGVADADQSRLKDAMRRVSDLESKGGTNIRGALKLAMDELANSQSGRSRAIIFLTDGQGNDPPETVLADVRARDREIRIFSFGVGFGVNRRFLQRLSRENRGMETFIDHVEEIETEITRLYERISMPLMVDLDIRFEGVDVQYVYPNPLPDLYRDSQLVITGRYASPGTGVVRISGRVQGEQALASSRGVGGGSASLVFQDKEILFPLVFPDVQPKHEYIEKLWASERASQLTDMITDAGGEGDPLLIQEVTRLGIVYNLVTEYTTFLAVPESLKTQEIKEMIKSGRQGYSKKLIDSMEGIRLSMTSFLPGDPVLSVEAPSTSLKVTAYFPFGLVLRLKYDAMRDLWSGRFLVPRDVPDGLYAIRVHILDPDGTSNWRVVNYYVDGTAPEFEADLPEVAVPGTTIPIEVDPLEPVAEVFAWIPGFSGTRVDLVLDPETGRYHGEIELPPHFPVGKITVRIVVRDLARNRFEEDFDVWADGEELPGC